MIIIVKQRRDDWVAYVKGEKGTWENGLTKAEALGELIISLIQNGKLEWKIEEVE